jgi:YidC/Oxa1 family membrane protein insertase
MKKYSYENRYSELYYEHKDGKSDYLGLGHNESETVENVSYIAYKQHFSLLSY